MMQTYKNKAEEQEGLDFSAEFNKLKSEKVEKASTREISVQFAVGCGCGGDYRTTTLRISEGVPLNNGDYVTRDEIKRLKQDYGKSSIEIIY